MIIKQVGASGQLSLGKEFAGRTVMIESPEAGVWLIRTAQVIPDNELWVHSPEALAKATAGLNWADETIAASSDLDSFEQALRTRWEELQGESLEE